MSIVDAVLNLTEDCSQRTFNENIWPEVIGMKLSTRLLPALANSIAGDSGCSYPFCFSLPH
jgi:hypothetical protein